MNDTEEFPVTGFPVALQTTTAAFSVRTVAASIPPTETNLSAVAVTRAVKSAVTLVPDQSVYRTS